MKSSIQSLEVYPLQDVKEKIKIEGIEASKNSFNSPIMNAMMGVLALAVVAGCGDPETTEKADSMEVMMEDEEKNVEEVKQELVGGSPWSFSVAKSAWAPTKTFTKIENRRYTACLNPTSGDPDLYGHYSGALTLSNFQFKSVNGTGKSDCIFFNAGSTGTYYLGVYGYSAADGNLWVTESLQNDVPSNFSKQLTWPLPGLIALADPPGQNPPSPNAQKTYGDSFSPFNSPWGNSYNTHRPYFDSSVAPGAYNKIHAGVDIYAPPGTPVKAACKGKFKEPTDTHRIGDQHGDFMLSRSAL